MSFLVPEICIVRSHVGVSRGRLFGMLSHFLLSRCSPQCRDVSIARRGRQMFSTRGLNRPIGRIGRYRR